jgi:hypothetical protein
MRLNKQSLKNLFNTPDKIRAGDYHNLIDSLENLTVGGGTGTGGNVITSTTLDNSFSLVLVDCSSQAITITLRDARQYAGKRYDIKKIDSTGNTVTVITTNNQTIDTVYSSKTIASSNSNMEIVSNGFNWYII